jgi:hypothetical protein
MTQHHELIDASVDDPTRRGPQKLGCGFDDVTSGEDGPVRPHMRGAGPTPERVDTPYTMSARDVLAWYNLSATPSGVKDTHPPKKNFSITTEQMVAELTTDPRSARPNAASHKVFLDQWIVDHIEIDTRVTTRLTGDNSLYQAYSDACHKHK